MRSGSPRNWSGRGHRLAGIRIDSGDLAFLSRRARQMLDQENLPYVKIVASNELDEYIISDILAQGGKVDVWGVGTNLVTGSGAGGGALGGIYKMVEHNGQPKIKLSANPEKMTNPGVKKIVRFYDADGLMEADALAADSEDLTTSGILIVDPNNPLRRKKLDSAQRTELLNPIVEVRQDCLSIPFHRPDPGPSKKGSLPSPRKPQAPP